jgi:hypothetical protein
MPANSKTMTFGSLFAGIPPGDSILDSKEPECDANGKSKSILMQDESSKNTGQTCDDMTTCEPFRLSMETGESTSSAAGFPARTFPLRDFEWESTVQGLACGSNISAAFAFYDRDSSSLRTWQTSVFGGWTEFSAILPRWGLMRNGQLFRVPSLGRITYGKDSLFWPTPNASDGMRLKFSIDQHSRQYHRRLADPILRKSGCRILNEELAALEGLSQTPLTAEWMMGFPPNWTDCESKPSETP